MRRALFGALVGIGASLCGLHPLGAAADLEAQCTALKADTAPFNVNPPVFSEHARETVLEPVRNGVTLFVPELAEQPLVKCGLIDVTKAPFNADPTGADDSTAALNKAVEFARRHMLVSYLPLGTYKVSDTIECAQGFYRRQWGQKTRTGPDRNGPCVMLGQLQGPRPTIHLAPNAPGFDRPQSPKYLVHFWARKISNPRKEQQNISMNQKFIGIDLAIGAGNGGAIGIRHTGAQGSVIQDTKIDATHGYAGIEGGLGSGGTIANVEVLGGEIGIDFSKEPIVPTLTGAALKGQSRHALRFGSRNTLVATGIEISVPPGASGPAVLVESPDYSPLNQIAMIDSRIAFASEDARNVAISSNRSVYLKNTYVRHAAAVVSYSDGSRLKGEPAGWLHVEEYAGAKETPRRRKGGKSYQYETTVYVNGRDLGYEALAKLNGVGGEAPGDLRARHLWRTDFPSWQSAAAANVKAAPYRAVGDGRADDTAAIQAAIDENELVFLPKGYFKISKPLVLKPNTKLVGLDSHLSVLIPAEGSSFTGGGAPAPMIQTADSDSADTVLAFFGIYVPTNMPGAYGLLWRSGPESVIRSVNFLRFPLGGRARDSDHPLVVASGHAGGKVYNFYQESRLGQGPGYRHLMIKDTKGLPIRLYAANPEHAPTDANMEIQNASNVFVYGLKSEGNYPVLWVRNSDSVSVFGFGGIAAALEKTKTYPSGLEQFTPSLIRIQNTKNLRLAALLDGMRVSGGSDRHISGRGIAPDLWHFLLEATPSGQEFLTPPLSRPVLYLRGFGYD